MVPWSPRKYGWSENTVSGNHLYHIIPVNISFHRNLLFREKCVYFKTQSFDRLFIPVCYNEEASLWLRKVNIERIANWSTLTMHLRTTWKKIIICRKAGLSISIFKPINCKKKENTIWLIVWHKRFPDSSFTILMIENSI